MQRFSRRTATKRARRPSCVCCHSWGNSCSTSPICGSSAESVGRIEDWQVIVRPTPCACARRRQGASGSCLTRTNSGARIRGDDDPVPNDRTRPPQQNASRSGIRDNRNRPDQRSFDRGFHSPDNRVHLDALLDVNALPRKGYPSKADREREEEESFAARAACAPGDRVCHQWVGASGTRPRSQPWRGGLRANGRSVGSGGQPASHRVASAEAGAQATTTRRLTLCLRNRGGFRALKDGTALLVPGIGHPG